MQFKKLPPAVSIDGLTPQQRDFVLAYVELGAEEGAAAEAALRAGYGRGIRKNADTYARRELLRNQRVLSAIKSELKGEFVHGAVLGVKTLIQLCKSGPANVQLSAAQELVNRGLGPVVSRSANVNLDVSAGLTAELLDEIKKQREQEKEALEAEINARVHAKLSDYQQLPESDVIDVEAEPAPNKAD